MGRYVELICEPEPKKKDIDNDVKIIIGEIEALDALADEIGVRALGEFGLSEQDEDDEDWDSAAFFDPKEAIESIDGLIAALRLPPPPKAKGKKKPASSDFNYERDEIIEELDELRRRLKLIARGKTRFRFVIVD